MYLVLVYSVSCRLSVFGLSALEQTQHSYRPPVVTSWQIHLAHRHKPEKWNVTIATIWCWLGTVGIVMVTAEQASGQCQPYRPRWTRNTHTYKYTCTLLLDNADSVLYITAACYIE